MEKLAVAVAGRSVLCRALPSAKAHSAFGARLRRYDGEASEEPEPDLLILLQRGRRPSAAAVAAAVGG